MKRVTYLLAILFLAVNSFAQGHFVVAFSGKGQDHMNITIVTATIGGVDLEAGDEIAAFDGTICCGKAILTQPIVITTKISFAAIAASRKDDGQSNGYIEGHAITLKFWDSGRNREISGISAEYLDPADGSTITAPTYSVNGSAFVKLTAPANQIPVSNAGSDQSVNEGDVVTLDGSASSDADSDPLTFTWTAPAGITLSSTTADKPTFTAPEVSTDTDFKFSLVVNDGTVNSTADEVVITVKITNQAPIADAGPNQSVIKGTLITLDGSASSDPDSDLLTFIWTAPAGITLSSTIVDKPTFSAPDVSADTEFKFSLVVNDGTVNSTADEVVITVKITNQAPIADAGPDRTVFEGDLVTLNSSASSDPDSDPLTFIWTAPAGITLSSTIVDKPTFTAPEVSADKEYKFSLVVNDGTVNSTADEVVITVKQVNKTPVANAGPDQTVNEGDLVTLDGYGSSDPDSDALTYKWTAPAEITLSSATADNPTFTAPEVSTDIDFKLSLIVNDGTVNSTANEVIITVKQVNKAPVANAGPDQSVLKGTLVTLDGAASSDHDGDLLTYSWTAPAGITLSSTTIDKPTFTAPDVIADTDFAFSLIVNDGTVDSPSDEVIITVKPVNQAPVANASPNQTVNEGDLVTLDGSGSSDPDSDPLTYQWTVPAGIILSSTTVDKPTFTAPEVSADKEYKFSLVVNDGTLNSIADEVVITVKQVNKTPAANAGPDQSVLKETLVTLDGAASSDPDGDLLTYSWTAPAGITLSSTTIDKPTFTAPDVIADTDFTFSLIVNDGALDSPVDGVVITIKSVNEAPAANAGPDQTVNEGVLVTLYGSGSSDPESDPLTYHWTAPAGITLSSTTVDKPTFTAPEVNTDTDFKFSLVVNDGTVNSTADEVVVTVLQVNKVPTANAGADQSVNEGATATLDGSASSDPDGDALSYKWTAPPGIVLSSEIIVNPTFTTPEVSADTQYKFTLVVNDGQADSPTDEVVITVLQVNKVPTANAGADQSVNEGATVSLDGSASSDPDGDALTYHWTAPAGISLSSTTADKPTFTAPEVSNDTDLKFSLVVNDGTVNSTADEVVITVKQVNKVPIACAGPDQTVNEGSLVTLDGSCSTDPDNNAMSFQWSVPGGIQLNMPIAIKVLVTGPPVTTTTNHDFSLIFSDGPGSNSFHFDWTIPAGITFSSTTVSIITITPPDVTHTNYTFSVNVFDGSDTTDPWHNGMTYFTIAPTEFIMSPTTIIKLNITAPEPTTLTDQTFSLEISVPGSGMILMSNSWTMPAGITIGTNTFAKLTITSPDGVTNTDYKFLMEFNDGSTPSNPTDGLTYHWTAPAGIILSSDTDPKPTFTAPKVSADKDYKFTLVVNDGQADSPADEVIITIKQFNKAPVANAGADQSVNEGATVSLDGSASSDPDGDALTYKWTNADGIILSSDTDPKPTFTAPEVSADKEYKFTLVVNDGQADSPADEVVITVLQVNKVPTANAGADQSVNEGATAALAGSASSDPDGNPLTYKWTAPPGILLSSEIVINPIFTASEVSADTQYKFSLVVNDGQADSPADEVVITVLQVNKVPTANAGADQSVNEGATATLDGSASSDLDGDALTYKWTNADGIVLSSDTDQKPTFTAPEVSADKEFKFTLVVNDGQADSPADEVVITVKNVDKAPYVKDPIDNVSVDKGAPDQIIDLKTVFADDDPGDVLIFSVTSNTNDQVVTALITGSNLTLDFSSVNIGSSEIVITASSNGKEVSSKFEVEVKIPTGIDLLIDDNNIQIYPNPTKGIVQLKFNQTPKAGTWITVFDITGRLIFKSLADNKEEYLNLKGNPVGLYFIKIDQKTPKAYKIVLE